MVPRIRDGSSCLSAMNGTRCPTAPQLLTARVANQTHLSGNWPRENASVLPTAWPIPMPDAYNVDALRCLLHSLKFEGNPREIDPEATRGKRGLTRCDGWFGLHERAADGTSR